MSAETLRKAAALMRERAEAVRKARREADGEKHGGPDARYSWVFLAGAFAHHAPGDVNDPELKAIWDADAKHLDPWQSLDVALAVADWLDWVADGWSWNPQPIGNEGRALAVARTYLGEDA